MSCLLTMPGNADIDTRWKVAAAAAETELTSRTTGRKCMMTIVLTKEREGLDNTKQFKVRACKTSVKSITRDRKKDVSLWAL
jgi:hypothetical protein